MMKEARPCRQYTYTARGWQQGIFIPEEYRIFASPIKGAGTLFMVETVEGEERASFVSEKRGLPARLDMARSLGDLDILTVGTAPIHIRGGTIMEMLPAA